MRTGLKVNVISVINNTVVNVLNRWLLIAVGLYRSASAPSSRLTNAAVIRLSRCHAQKYPPPKVIRQRHKVIRPDDFQTPADCLLVEIRRLYPTPHTFGAPVGGNSVEFQRFLA